ncbi:ABC transporter permease [Mongoliitalea lutea]|uniref:ABC transporter permease n=2 Tax=Mongoliitalea lutea TaxID=849756 RepID=A0A8J3CW04_9BACT|nr:ABC transporter permease [Mongoliitalea lutea]
MLIVLQQLLLATFPVGILILTKGFFDAVLTSSQNSIDDMLIWLLGLGGLQVMQAIISQWHSYQSGIFQQKVSDKVASDIIQKSIEIPFAYFEDARYHDSLHLAQKQSVYKIPQLFTQLQQTFTQLLSLIFLLGYFFSLLQMYAWLVVLIALPLAVIKWYNGFALYKLEKKLVPQERESTYYHHILTTESFAHEVRTLDFGKGLLQKFIALKKLILDQKSGLQRNLLSYAVIAELAEIGVLLYILFKIASNALDGLLEISLLIVYLQGIQRMQQNLKGFLNSFVQLLQMRLFLKDLFRFLGIHSGSPVFQGKELFPQTPIKLSLAGVDFIYPEQKKQVLSNISMELQSGQVIGIVGENGSGKSTLVKLLAGLYSDKENRIRLNGKPLESYEEKSYRKHTLFLFQDFQRYYFSIADSIRLGLEGGEGDDSKITSAVQQANAMDFVSKFPKGIHAKLGRIFGNGNALSGGQWQKLTIARAFYRDAQIIVLDEPTSALDAMSESEIFKNLMQNRSDKLIILITHRLYNLKHADRIFVFEGGAVVQEGNFDHLIQEEGVFKNLYLNQNFD